MSAARPVYSTGPGGGRSFRRGRDGAVEEPQTDLAPGRHALRVRLDRSGRKGKQVTVAGPLFLTRETARGLLKHLRKGCGTGGTLKVVETPAGEPAFELELQGDHVGRAVDALASRDYPVKRSGG